MISDPALHSPARHNNASVPLANKLKIALESCEPDIFKLLSAIHECLTYLDVLLGNNAAILQAPGYNALLDELNTIIKGDRKQSITTANSKLKDANTQTDNDCLRAELNTVYNMMKRQRDGTLGMIQDLSLMVRKYIPPRKSLEELYHEIDKISKSQTNLSNYLEYLKYEIIKHRVRPGKDRIMILIHEQQSLTSKLARCRHDLLHDIYSYQKSDMFTELLKIVQEQDMQDLKMKSLLDILNQVVALQESKDSIEGWINRTKDEAHYIKELEIRMKCYTSQERLDSLHEMELIRKFEREIFGQNSLLRELKASIEAKPDLMSSVMLLEKKLAKKYQDYISILWGKK